MKAFGLAEEESSMPWVMEAMAEKQRSSGEG
jgi:hypothetical protein